MSNWLPACYAAAVGAAGSLAYFTALYFGFIGGEEILNRFWPPGRLPWYIRSLRILWYALAGAVVAFVFQLPEANFAPIQAFIVGTTWPTIVSQILTGRQAETPETIRAQITALMGE